jgi:probable F420-dependent oxidoreductase
MKIGVVFPQTEFKPDPNEVRDYTLAVENLGYAHIHAYDHILGANPERPDGWTGPYTHKNTFLEPFVLFSYMAGFTNRLEFGTCILILPQRQTALVAKQAATLDVLSNGRFRLGVGVGWNEVEYISLGENFHNRGRREEEQVELLRLLWTQPLVNFEGRWHKIPDAGLNPLPIQQPIPIWFGGTHDQALHRMARLGDGWMVNVRSMEQVTPLLEKLRQYLDEAGRDQASFGIEARMNMSLIEQEGWISYLQSWDKLGATHLTINTMGCGYDTTAAHLQALKRFAETVGLKDGEVNLTS